MKSFLLLMYTALVAISCNTMQPALSVSGSSALENFAVKGRQGFLINQKLRFGEYETSRVKRSWTRGGSSSYRTTVGDLNTTSPDILSLDFIDKEQVFHFQMSDTAIARTAGVYASSNFSSKNLNFTNVSGGIGNVVEDIFGVTLKSDDLFYLQLFVNEESQPWELVLDNEAAQFLAEEYQGIFAKNEQEYYTLKPLTQVQGKNGPENLLLGSIGYEVFNSSKESVGAVSLVDGGHVYFHTADLEERFLLANLFAGLLLQEDISE